MPPSTEITLFITEIFHSIQGESTSAGLPCAFVRLTGCNLRCAYCDTTYAFSGGTEMTLSEILRTIGSFGCRLVEVTGGEPLLQPGVDALFTALCDAGYDVLLETGGSLDISSVDPRVRRIVDLKCPSSGMCDQNFWPNLSVLKTGDEIKFVIGTREDYDWAKDVMKTRGLSGRCPVLFSPVHGRMEPAELAGWILEDRLNVRFQMQLHKHIWHPEARGV
jgi:7-carboxy-7-deazaguanine synthase